MNRKTQLQTDEPVIVVLHDIELGLGHRIEDPERARLADAMGKEALQRMLEVEARHGVHATYNVVGTLFSNLEGPIRTDGHELAFHSFDHNIIEAPDHCDRQVQACRDLDEDVVGYRPPQSKIGVGLHAALKRHRFRWLASGARSLGVHTPTHTDELFLLPVIQDDFPLYRGTLGYDDWEAELFEIAERTGYLAVGLHDCYGDFWLEHYPRLLSGLKSRGRLVTVSEAGAL